jgi:hypothetical protein
VGIGGDSLADEPPMLACLALPGKPVNSAGHHHRNHETRVITEDFLEDTRAYDIEDV